MKDEYGEKSSQSISFKNVTVVLVTAREGTCCLNNYEKENASRGFVGVGVGGAITCGGDPR